MQILNEEFWRYFLSEYQCAFHQLLPCSYVSCTIWVVLGQCTSKAKSTIAALLCVSHSVVSVSQSSVWIDADTRCKFFVANRLHVWKNHGNRGEFNVLKNSWLSRFFQLSLKSIFPFWRENSSDIVLISSDFQNDFVDIKWAFSLHFETILGDKHLWEIAYFIQADLAA